MTDSPARALRLVREADAPPAGHDPASTDLPLLAAILIAALVPIVGQLAGGHWGQGALGLATAAALLSGRELLLEVRARWRR